MKTKIIQSIPAVLVLAIIGFVHFSLWCTEAGHICYRTRLDSIFIDTINPLYFFVLYSLPLVIVLVIIPRYLFNSWAKFAAVALFFLVIFIVMQPVSSTHILSSDRDDAARLASEILSAGSLIVMAFSLIRYRIRGNQSGVKEAEALLAAGIGCISTAVFSWTLFSNDLGWLGTLLVAGAISILMNLFALYRVIVLAYREKKAHAELGLKLSVAILLITASVVICIISFLIALK